MSEYDDLLKPIKHKLTINGLNVINSSWSLNFWGMLSLVSMVFLNYGNIIYLAKNVGDIENIQYIAESGGVLGSTSSLFVKVVVLVLKRNEITSFYNEIKEHYSKSRNEYKETTNMYARQFSFVTKLFSGIVYILPPLYILNSLYGNEIPELPLLITIPFLPFNGWPFFHINFVVQLLLMWIGCHLSVAIELLTFFYIHYLCCRIEILTHMVDRWNENIKCRQSDKNDHILLQEIVEYHSSIKRNMDSIRSIFSPMLMAVLLSNSIVICMCLVIMFVNPILKIFSHFLLAISQTFMYCYVGNILIKQNDNLVEKILLVDFYYLKASERKSYVNVVQNACKPIKLQSYFVTVDMTLFFKVVKFGYSIFSLMKTKV